MKINVGGPLAPFQVLWFQLKKGRIPHNGVDVDIVLKHYGINRIGTYYGY